LSASYLVHVLLCNLHKAGAAVVQVMLESEDDIVAADAMIAVMYGVSDALTGIS
jgi:hypothetical protein